MSILKRIDEDLIKALKARNELETTLLRGLKSDIKYKQIESGKELDDQSVIAVLTSAAKRRRDSIEQFKAGNRQDLVDKESAELDLIMRYLPEQLSEEKLRGMIEEAIAKTGVEDSSGIGMLMKELMPQVKGKADGKIVKELVTAILTGKQE